MHFRIILLIVLLPTPFFNLYSKQNPGAEHIFKDVIDDRLEQMQELALEIVSTQTDKADSIAREILSKSKKSQIRYKALGYYILGEAEYYREHYNLALKYYRKAEPYLEMNSDSVKMAANFSNLGLMYLYKANYKKSLLYYERSFELEKLISDTLGMAKSLQNMGLIVGHWGKYEMQNDYYKQAIALYEELDDKKSMADMALNLGVSLIFQDELDEGYNYYKKALHTYEELNDSDRIASVYTNLGYYKIRVKEYGEALGYFNKGIGIFKTLDKKSGLIQSYTGLGDLYVAMGQRRKAVDIYQKCELINQKVGLLDTRGENLFSLYEAYKSMGDVENALRVFEQHQLIKDSIFNLEQFEKILELENKYVLQKSQSQVSELKARNRLYTIISLGVSFLVISGGIFMFFYTRDRSMKEKQRLLSLEQKVLRTQMNPHFIFNSLSAIQCYILENKTMDAVDFLADFASLMRMVLHYSKEEYISLEQEREILDFYIDLQNKRFGDKVKYEIQIDEELENTKIMIPPMLAQPFIENSFEHGELYKKDDGHISVKFKKKGKNLSYMIEDNGVGISSKRRESSSPSSKKHKSLALKITKERLKLINNNHTGARVALLVEDRIKYGENGTRVEFTIPLQVLN
ncbi:MULTISPECIES: tetratricopeptide repeat protein [unclassified Saccharicrinis]|uniref:tetratricopeptide repeat protein n=1 Tax=unclassified Saccharicrinis TaxID=2646859 RepID=UPI003D32E501